MMKIEKPQHNVVFRVPNTDEGKDFIEKAKKFINKDSYSITLRGRSKNRKQRFAPNVTSRYYRIEVPVNQAESWGVYLVAKTSPQRVIGITDTRQLRYVYAELSKTERKLFLVREQLQKAVDLSK